MQKRIVSLFVILACASQNEVRSYGAQAVQRRQAATAAAADAASCSPTKTLVDGAAGSCADVKGSVEELHTLMDNATPAKRAAGTLTLSQAFDLKAKLSAIPTYFVNKYGRVAFDTIQLVTQPGPAVNGLQVSGVAATIDMTAANSINTLGNQLLDQLIYNGGHHTDEKKRHAALQVAMALIFVNTLSESDFRPLAGRAGSISTVDDFKTLVRNNLWAMDALMISTIQDKILRLPAIQFVTPTTLASTIDWEAILTTAVSSNLRGAGYQVPGIDRGRVVTALKALIQSRAAGAVVPAVAGTARAAWAGGAPAVPGAAAVPVAPVAAAVPRGAWAGGAPAGAP